MMECRSLCPKHKRQLAFKLWDQLPQPPVPLSLLFPILSMQVTVHAPVLSDESRHPIALGPFSLPSSIVGRPMADPKTLDTVPNIFELVHHYSTKLAKDTYNSDECLSLMDLSDIPAVDPAELGFHSFPNQSSFCLADWHWNGGYRNLWEASKIWWHSSPTQILAPTISNLPTGAAFTQSWEPVMMKWAG